MRISDWSSDGCSSDLGGQRRSEPPRPHAEPPEVLQGVAEVGQLPVEDGPQALLVDEEVPEAEVAMHHADGGGGGAVGLEPPETELEGRVRLFQRVEPSAELLELVGLAQPLDGIAGP